MLLLHKAIPKADKSPGRDVPDRLAPARKAYKARHSVANVILITCAQFDAHLEIGLCCLPGLWIDRDVAAREMR